MVAALSYHCIFPQLCSSCFPEFLDNLEHRFGKSTHISMISNSVTHLRSYTNSAIAGNSARSPRRAPTSPHRATMSPHRAPISSHRMTSARSPTSLPQTQTSPHRASTSPHRALTSPHRAPISSDRMRLFHDFSQCFKCFMMFYNVSKCFTCVSCFTMFNNIL